VAGGWLVVGFFGSFSFVGRLENESVTKTMCESLYGMTTATRPPMIVMGTVVEQERFRSEQSLTLLG
jgi:hypothetical protein